MGLPFAVLGGSISAVSGNVFRLGSMPRWVLEYEDVFDFETGFDSVECLGSA